MGRLGAISGAHPTVLDAGKTQKTDMLKMYVFLKDWDDFWFFGALLTASWGVLGSSWAVSRPSRSLLERSCAVLGLSCASPMTPLIALSLLARPGKAPWEARKGRGTFSKGVRGAPGTLRKGVRGVPGEGIRFHPGGGVRVIKI